MAAQAGGAAGDPRKLRYKLYVVATLLSRHRAPWNRTAKMRFVVQSTTFSAPHKSLYN